MQDYITNTNLPIVDVLPELQLGLAQNATLILSAPPGAGKSTLVPLELLDAAWLGNQKIIMLEPRRLAAKTVAMRMADLLNESVGETVGYRIRFESRVSAKTRIEVVTEGILTRMLQSDNSLEGVGIVIFDEFHERSIFADVALALSREAQQILREDLRILVMSATLNLTELKTLLNAPVVESSGKQYPVDLIYTDQQDERLMAEVCAQTAIRALREQQGDILIFLPGEGEIRKCEEILRSMGSRPYATENISRPHTTENLEIHPLYGNLPPNQQMAAIMPSRSGARKVVIATSIAETSLTIEGIKVVVDSGFGRVQKFDPRSGLSKLETILISKDSADQRAGRAGRLSPGVCYRLWSKPAHARLADHRNPEIIEADLASFVLDMAMWGVKDINSLTWLTPPPPHHVKLATELLEELNALEPVVGSGRDQIVRSGRDRTLTEHGKKMHALPCHPRIAHMMLMAANMRSGSERSLTLAADIAALLEERDPLGKEGGIDINLRIEAMRRQRSRTSSSSAKGGAGGKFGRILKIAEQYRKMFDAPENNDAVDPFETGVLLVYAYPERIAFARPGNNAQFQLSGGNLAMASHQDDLAHEPWLAIANLDARDGMGKIFLASPLNPKDLMPLLKEREIITWNTKKGGLTAARETRLGSIVLKSTPLPNPNPAQIQLAICEAIQKEGAHLLDWNNAVTQFQNRILSLKKWNENQDWPDVSTSTLLAQTQDWLLPYLNNIKSNDDLKKLNLHDMLYHFLDFEKQNLLNKLAPTKLEVPSGSQITLEYFANGSAPVLAVRIQEVFGLEDTPAVNNGKVKVLMHLLSPGYKPCQITGDLKNFWQNTYFEVRKELKPRYPKHAWPDDPWNHPAIRGTKKQNGLK
ncbi:MAG: ATP-dependent helicase HrpB [Bacteroidetes bacterium]|nr:ATP-dependent helicase HrpB [Bacteroidota bacterium]